MNSCTRLNRVCLDFVIFKCLFAVHTVFQWGFKFYVINQDIPLNNGSNQALLEFNKRKGFTLILAFPVGMNASETK